MADDIARALRIISDDMAENGTGFRTDPHQIEAAAIRQGAELITRLRAQVEALKPWAHMGRDVMECWPSDIDGGDLQDLAMTRGVLRAVPGGFNPEYHDDMYGSAEEGDDWMQLNHFPLGDTE